VAAREPQPWECEGPVQVEVFVLRLGAGGLELTGPCGPDAWYLEVGEDDDPVAVVTAAARRMMGEPLLVHSTSWRRDRGSVILSFVVVVDPTTVASLDGVPVGRAELARSTTLAAPERIGHEQVIEHGLRHLAWLAKDDPHVRAALSEEWRALLAGYVPEPFRNL
jgi:hypothetical protein